MGRRLILDTNVLVDIERGALRPEQLLDHDVAIAAITIAELSTGVHLLAPEQADRARRHLDAILHTLPVLEYTPATAEQHAKLRAHTIRAGRPRGAHDLILAAHAVESGRTILSYDARARFDALPGVRAEMP